MQGLGWLGGSLDGSGGVAGTWAPGSSGLWAFPGRTMALLLLCGAEGGFWGPPRWGNSQLMGWPASQGTTLMAGSTGGLSCQGWDAAKDRVQSSFCPF